VQKGHIAPILKLVHTAIMRTNVNIADDAREFAMVYADAKGMTLGDAITELIREGQRAVSGKPKFRGFARSSAGFPMFPLSGRKLTTEQARKAEEDEIA
jgi:hypothetical protein